ncbi:hypothetical protein VTN02DRAFT_5637 [Thermoascus thermophilus]
MNALETAFSSRADNNDTRPGSTGSSSTAGLDRSSNRKRWSRTSSSSTAPQSQTTSQRMPASNEAQQPSNDEITPIIGSGSRDQRSYQSTGNSDQSAPQGPKDSTNPDLSRANSDRGTTANPGPSWYKRLADKYGSLELDNKGSVARDHLALERTFLAWLRTSLAFASIGIAVTQLFRLSNSVSSREVSHISSDDSLLHPPLYNTTAIHVLAPNSRLQSVGKPLGATFIGVAIMILLIGFHRYFESQYWIVRGKFPASRGSVALVAFVAASLIVVSLVVIIAISPSVTEK